MSYGRSEPGSSMRTEILDEMQRIAPAGQSELDSEVIQQLRGYTSRLAEQYATEGGLEYERFVATTSRELHIDTNALYSDIRDKHIVVTGGTGCIGSALLSQLIKYSPRTITSLSRGVTMPRQVTEGVDYRNTDLRASEATAKIIKEIKPDIIYHLAAQHDPSLAETEARRTLATNILGTQNIINAVIGADVPQIVYASTGRQCGPSRLILTLPLKRLASGLWRRPANKCRSPAYGSLILSITQLYLNECTTG